jgi:hypothetical protein
MAVDRAAWISIRPGGSMFWLCGVAWALDLSVTEGAAGGLVIKQGPDLERLKGIVEFGILGQFGMRSSKTFTRPRASII